MCGFWCAGMEVERRKVARVGPAMPAPIMRMRMGSGGVEGVMVEDWSWI